MSKQSQPKTSKKQVERTATGQLKKGSTANPNGRPPKGYSITETMKDMLGAKPEIKQALSSKVLEMALKGDIAALKLVWQYMDGNPSQPIEHSGTITSAIINYVRPTDHLPTDSETGSSLELPDGQSDD